MLLLARGSICNVDGNPFSFYGRNAYFCSSQDNLASWNLDCAFKPFFFLVPPPKKETKNNKKQRSHQRGSMLDFTEYFWNSFIFIGRVAIILFLLHESEYTVVSWKVVYKDWYYRFILILSSAVHFVSTNNFPVHTIEVFYGSLEVGWKNIESPLSVIIIITLRKRSSTNTPGIPSVQRNLSSAP